MSLELKIIQDIKTAMLSKDKVRLEVCRAIKSAILLYKTEKNNKELKETKNNAEKDVKETTKDNKD